MSMPNPGALSVLNVNPLFRNLSKETLVEISGLCRNRSYKRGATVFEEGTPGTKLFGVISGRLIITATSAEGAELHLNVMEQGEIVGEIAFLDGGLRTATGRAAEATTCFEIERDAFFTLLERSPALSTHLLQLVCKRIRWMTTLATDAAFLSVPERLAKRLREMAKPNGQGSALEARISQNELASFLGVSRQVINGYLGAWQRLGYIDISRGIVRIKDLTDASLRKGR